MKWYIKICNSFFDEDCEKLIILWNAGQKRHHQRTKHEVRIRQVIKQTFFTANRMWINVFFEKYSQELI